MFLGRWRDQDYLPSNLILPVPSIKKKKVWLGPRSDLDMRALSWTAVPSVLTALGFSLPRSSLAKRGFTRIGIVTLWWLCGSGGVTMTLSRDLAPLYITPAPRTGPIHQSWDNVHNVHIAGWRSSLKSGVGWAGHFIWSEMSEQLSSSFIISQTYFMWTILWSD